MGEGGGGGGHTFFHRIFFDEYVFRPLFLLFFGFSLRFGHWPLNFLTTPQSDDGLDFIHSFRLLAGKAMFMHSPRIGQCLRGEPSFLQYLWLIVQATDGCYHIGHQLVAYFGPQHLHFQPSNPLLRGKLENALPDDWKIEN